VRKSFETFDLDKTGFINRNELVIALDTLGVRADQNFVTSLLNSADR
jgi:Ca2+-binding EF-hand superfamily protein